MSQVVADAPHRVVVVGGGFAGLETARELGRNARRAGLEVVLIDRHNYHTFQPLLYQVAMAELEPQSVGHNLRGILRRLPVDVRLGTVLGFDLEARRVALADGERVSFDTLVLAPGASTADYGIEGVAEHALRLKTLPHAARLRNHLLSQFERLAADGAAEHATFVVAGGGPTGVELAGALSELLEQVVRRDHAGRDLGRLRVLLVEMLDTLLPTYDPRSRRYARRALEARGVEVRLGTAIERVAADHVVLSDGDRIPTATVVWTAGVRANPLADRSGLEQTRGGRLRVARDLRVPGRDDVFVVGDLAACADERGSPLPQLAPVAIQQGRHAARQVLRLRLGEPTVAFRYIDRGTMAVIGRRDAVAELPFRLRLGGVPAWLAWLGLHLLWLIGFRNRASVLVNWAYNYLTHDRAARLLLDQHEPDEPDEGTRAAPGTRSG